MKEMEYGIRKEIDTPFPSISLLIALSFVFGKDQSAGKLLRLEMYTCLVIYVFSILDELYNKE